MTERSYDVEEFANRSPGSDPFYESICRAMVATLRGNEVEAIRQIERAIDGFVALGDLHGEGRARSKAVILFRRIGDVHRAIQEAERSLHCFKQYPDPGYEAMVYLELGQVASERGDTDKALGYYQTGMHRVGDPVVGEDEVSASARAFISDVSANCYAVKGQWDRVEQLRRSAIAGLEALGEPHFDRDLVISYANLGRDCIYTRRPENARQALAKAEAVLQAMRKRGDFDPECQASFDAACAQFDKLMLRM